jgi:cyclophilin family peptidyl-prolyl cis-trans isomerase
MNYGLTMITAIFLGLSTWTPFALAEEKVLLVKIQTTLGPIEAKLFYDKAPSTVSNFVTLARKGYYNGIVFHRVIPKFMIQTGDPQGNGTGGPGYSFADEFHPSLKHDKAGMLSMANAGPNTNGSQFFITVAPTAHLDNRHAIFGEVTKGLDIAEKISNVPATSDKPKTPVLMEKVEIVGDWYKPLEYAKVVALTETDVKKITADVAKNLLTKIGEAQNLGKLIKHEYKYSRIDGQKAQVAYVASFANEKDAQILLLGKAEKNSFDVQQLQFAKGPTAVR